MKRTDNGMVETPVLFDLRQTLDCGQCFRWQPLLEEDGCAIWEGIAFGSYLIIEQHRAFMRFHCSKSDFDRIWYPYFDLSTDYRPIHARLSKVSPVMQDAIAYAPGLRILRQQPWETVCAFIFSQNNHIPRIKGIIARFCELLGQELAAGQFCFPEIHSLVGLTPDALDPIRAGFRAKYILHAAQEIANERVSLSAISEGSTAFGLAHLQKIKGIGPKVANCILLYGFHKYEAFPLDVWMQRAMHTLFPGKTPAIFGEYAGLAQQYLFHYGRMHPELFKQ